MPERGGVPHRHGAQGFQRGVRATLGKDEPWNEHILLTAEKFLAYMRMMEEDGNSLLASVTTLSGMVTGLEQLYAVTQKRYGRSKPENKVLDRDLAKD